MTIYTDPEENEDYGFVFPPHGHRPPEIRYPRPRHRHRHHHPLVSTPLGMGPRGPKGDTFSFDDLTDEQLAELREDVASVYHRKLESVYTTTGESTSQIPIPWDNFDPGKDMLFVRIEGLWLHANEYTVSEGNIVLTTPITQAGTAVGITMITTVAMSVEDIEDLHGEDGFSPTISMVRQGSGTLLSITDADGTTSALIPDGAIGPTGQTGPMGPAGPQGLKGDKGDKGDVGPVGPKGQKGDKGDKGDAGLQGPKGDTGDQGPQGMTGSVGPQGEDGADGFSPTVSVQPITGGHEVTITDEQGAHSFDVMDGEGGGGTDSATKAHVEQLWGNQLTKELTGEVLTAADAYAAPPMALTIEGKSTQLTTTGKNLLSDRAEDWVVRSTPDGDKLTFAIPVESGKSYNWNSGGVITGTMYWSNDATDYSSAAPTGITALGRTTVTNDGGYLYLVIAHAPQNVTAWVNLLKSYSAIVEEGSAFTSYEPYTGGKPSPGPEYPQEIVSVEQVNMHFDGRNMLDLNFVDQYTLESGGTRFIANGDGTFTIEAIADSGGSKTVGLIKGTGFRHINVNYPIGLPSTVANGAFQLPTGTYTFKSYSSNDETKVYLRIRHGAYNAMTDGSNNVTFTTDGTEWCQLFIYVQSFSTLLANGPVTLRAQLEVGSTATAYQPYDGTSVQLPVTLRSLPDGTKDTLALSYLRPSTREGYAWYSAELVQNVMLTDMGALTWVNYYGNRIFYANVSGMAKGIADSLQAMCEIFKPYNTASLAWFGNRAPANSIALLASNTASIGVTLTPETAYESAAAFKAAMSGVYAHVPIATPVTTTLDPIELPILPAPDVTVWADVATGLKMRYVRDTNLAYAQLEAAIADLATS